MRSPLFKRHLRDLRRNAVRYIAMLLVLVFGVGMGNGSFQAAENCVALVNGIREAYQVEDGRFTTFYGASEEVLDQIESSLGASVYENFSYDAEMAVEGSDGPATVRLYKNRTDVDLAVYAQGREPQAPDEIALDRLFMQNNGIAVGDEVQVGGTAYTVVGAMTLPDYAALFQNNSDFVFNALTFSVAQVVPEAFDAAAGSEMTFTYSFAFDERDLSASQRHELEERMVDILVDAGYVPSEFLDYAANQGISYVVDDMGRDRGMFLLLTSLFTIVIALIFAVLTSASIERESPVIGTLLAMGYRKSELAMHYMAIPLLVGVVGCILGDVFGGTMLEGVMRDSYYGAYSLPPYERQANLHVYVLTTVVPFVLLSGITLFNVTRKLGCTPLQFLRSEAFGTKGGKGLVLPAGMSYSTRFGVRLLVRNAAGLVAMFVGIVVANTLLVFGLSMLPMVDDYAQTMKDEMVAEHLYVLKDSLEIDATEQEREAFAAAEDLITRDPETVSINISMLRTVQLASTVDMDAHPVNRYETPAEVIEQAEKYAVCQVEAAHSFGDGVEKVGAYGIREGSAYWTDVDVTGGKVVVDGGLAQKCGLSVGGTVRLADPITGKVHEMEVGAVTDRVSSTNAYMEIGYFNETFGNEDGYFNGYASNEPLELDKFFLVSDTTPHDLDAISNQMHSTFDEIMVLVMGISVPVFLIVVFLLTKTVIDRSARSISYMKVFGYRDGEVDALYVRPITVAVAVSFVLSLAIIAALIPLFSKVVFSTMSGNFVLSVPAWCCVLDLVVGAVAYTFVLFMHMRNIRRVPLALALKVQE